MRPTEHQTANAEIAIDSYQPPSAANAFLAVGSGVLAIVLVAIYLLLILLPSSRPTERQREPQVPQQ